MHRRRRNQRGVEVLLYVLVLLRVFCVYKRERERSAIREIRKRDVIAQRDGNDDDEEDKEEEAKEEER